MISPKWTYWILVSIMVLCIVPDMTIGDEEEKCTKMKCLSGDLIERSFMCDGYPDCSYGEDETMCSNHTDENCTRYLECYDSTVYPMSEFCDGKPGCDTWEDEIFCPGIACWWSNELFQCDDKCIFKKMKCDGVKNCPSGDDEKDCTETCASTRNFQCDDGTCIYKKYRCDGMCDCHDGEDEMDCDCTALERFACTNDSCVPMEFKCDGKKDCQNGKDEEICDCEKNEMFKCDDGKCIEYWRTCNGENDCTSGNDEKDCNCLARGMFHCGGSHCIDFAWTCDADPDCIDERDEKCVTKERYMCSFGLCPLRSIGNCSARHEVECGNGACIDPSWVCDKFKDCDTDEKNCNYTEPEEDPCDKYSVTTTTTVQTVTGSGTGSGAVDYKSNMRLLYLGFGLAVLLFRKLRSPDIF